MPMLVSIPIGFLGSPPGKAANARKEREDRKRVNERMKGDENREEKEPIAGERRRDVSCTIPVRVEERI